MGAHEHWLYDSIDWFAWRPVRTTAGRWAWMRWIVRRETNTIRTGHGGNTGTVVEYLER